MENHTVTFKYLIDNAWKGIVVLILIYLFCH